MSYEDELIRESTGEGMGLPPPDDYDEILAENKSAEGLVNTPDKTAEEIAKCRQAAIRCVLSTLLHPMKMMCLPDRAKAYAEAIKHRVTAVELLDAARGIERAQFTIEGR